MQIIKVNDKWRTNPLSETPGGSTILVEDRGRIKIYDKIKHIRSYIGVLKKNKYVTKVWLQDENGKQKILWQRK